MITSRSLVVDRLRDNFSDQNVVVAHLYFDYRNQEYQSTANMLASLLKQLAIPKAELPKPILELHQRLNSQEKRPQQQEIEDALLLTCQDYDRVFIIIDALDECDVRTHRKHFLKSLETLRTKSSSRIFITSRPYPDDIKKSLESAPQIIISADDEDLQRYISRELDNSDNLEVIDEELREKIIMVVSQAAQKMCVKHCSICCFCSPNTSISRTKLLCLRRFLLAVLQIQTILAEPTAGELEEALKALPLGLNDAFQETLQRIHNLPDGRRRLGLNTLMWVSHVCKPLTVAKLSDVLAVKLGETSLNTKYRPLEKMMVDCCLGLVTVDEESSVIRLVHYTVQEYLRGNLDQTFPLGEQTVAELSITYLLAKPFSRGCCPDQISILAVISQYPFIRYAAQLWEYHVKKSNSERANKLAIKFLQERPQLALSDQISHYTRGYVYQYWEAKEASSVNGLHVAAYFGLDDLAKQLLDAHAIDIDSATNMGTTALIHASSSGRIRFLKMLLERGADTRKENWYGTALHCSAESGEVSSIIELGMGIDVNIRDRRGRTPLECATESRHVEAMLELVKRGASLDDL